MAAIRPATGSSARAQSGSMISDNSRPDTGVTLGHSADIASATIDGTHQGICGDAGPATGPAGARARRPATSGRVGRSLLNGNLNAH